MISSVNLALRALDGIEQQVKNLQKTIKREMEEAPEPVPQALNDILQKVNSPKKTMSIEGPSIPDKPLKILEKLSRLSASVELANVAPTRHQMEYLQKLQDEYQKAIQKVDSLITHEVPKLSKVLHQHGILPILAEKPIKSP